ncbi:MAG: Fic family protein [Campylobacterales bacterium]|nr:Fic family protein [Campylobacterales bacterium]
MNKKYPTTNDEWIKYLTIDNYFTDNEIEYRKHLIKESNCNFEVIKEKIENIRQNLKVEIFKFENKSFYFVETVYLKNKIEQIKEFFKNREYLLKEIYTFELLKESLIKECFSSSSIEGAFSTIARTKELVEKKDTPKDISEQMISNNFEALMFIKDKNEDIDNDFIKYLHKIVTENTLDNGEDEGNYRKNDVDIKSAEQKIIFSAPHITIALQMLDELIEFLKDNDFLKPIDKIYKTIAFHFLFAYIHPFMDGNGRTVRILFTHLLKLYNYDMFYYISISEIINKDKKSYYKAFVDVERSNNNSHVKFDMTYFFYYLSNIMLDGLHELKLRITTYFRDEIVNNIVKQKNIDLTPRQQKIIKILSNEKKSFMLTSKELSKVFKISERIIQKDLKLLKDFELIERVPAGKKNYFKLKVS